MATAGSRTADLDDDPTHYLVDDNTGESLLQKLIITLLLPLVRRFIAERGVRALVGGNQFIYWKKYAPDVCIAPDLYIIPGLDPDLVVRSCMTWRLGASPTFALEVFSDDYRKDYVATPRKAEELGLKELVVFDPEWEEHRRGIRWQVFRRDASGSWIVAEKSFEDRVRSEELGAWLISVGTGGMTRLRIGLDPNGDELYPTDEENAAIEKQRADAEKKRADAEKKRATAEEKRATAEKKRADAAQREVERLEAELKKLR